MRDSYWYDLYISLQRSKTIRRHPTHCKPILSLNTIWNKYDVQNVLWKSDDQSHAENRSFHCIRYPKSWDLKKDALVSFLLVFTQYKQLWQIYIGTIFTLAYREVIQFAGILLTVSQYKDLVFNGTSLHLLTFAYRGVKQLAGKLLTLNKCEDLVVNVTSLTVG